MTSSFEKPNTNASLLSIRGMSTSSPNSSDRRVVNSRPPNPAPRTRMRMARPYLSTDPGSIAATVALGRDDHPARPQGEEVARGRTEHALARGRVPRAEVHELCL